MTQADLARILKNIANCDDPKKLRVYMRNAREREAAKVYDAAFHRLISIQPSARVGTVAYDVWRTIHAFEELLREERGKTIQLSRTRQAIQRKGEAKTVADLVLKKTPSDGFKILFERGQLELSFEAIVVARSDHFASDVVKAAHNRLIEAGADLDAARSYWRH